MHQMTRRHSQAPFKRIRGSVQMVLFHPLKPNFFVAVNVPAEYLEGEIADRVIQTQRYVRVYNLSEQKLLKTLTPGIKWISSMDVHPSGDHLIVGGYDRKLCWFDLELSDKPYKILKLVLHFHLSLHALNRYIRLDIIPAQSDHSTFTLLIHYLPHHPMMRLSRSSMLEYSTT